MNWIDRPSALRRRKFSMICGEKTTTQHAIDIEPHIPDMASTSRFKASVGGAMVGWTPGVLVSPVQLWEVESAIVDAANSWVLKNFVAG